MRAFLLFCGFYMGLIGSSQAQIDTSLNLVPPEGMTLVRTQSADHMPLSPNDARGMGVALPGPNYFGIARFIKNDLPPDSLEAAKSSIYGVYSKHPDGPSPDDGTWIIKPEWSGLYTLNSDFAIVRKPGKDMWYFLTIKSGKTKKIGAGEIGVADVLHQHSVDVSNLYKGMRYYLIEADNGSTQTIRPLKWKRSNAGQYDDISIGIPAKDVISRSHPSGRLPVQVTFKGDHFFRGLLPSGEFTEGFMRMKCKKKKCTEPRLDHPDYSGDFEVTSPSRYLLKVLDREAQLFLPIATSFDIWEFNRTRQKYQADGYTLKGFKPIGKHVTLESKPFPLEQRADSGFAVVWDTPKGKRLAPVFGAYHSSCQHGVKSDCRDTYKDATYFPYPDYTAYGFSRIMAEYIALEHIFIPDQFKHNRGNTRAFAAAVRAEYPDGRYDIIVKIPHIPYMTQFGQYTHPTMVYASKDPFTDRQAALAFEAQLFTKEGFNQFHSQRHAIVKHREREMKLAAMTESERSDYLRQVEIQKAYARQKEAERRAREAARGRIDQFVARKDWASTMSVVDNEFYGLYGYSVIEIIGAGGAYSLTTKDLYNGLSTLHDVADKNIILNELDKRLPPQVRAAPYSGFSGVSGNEQAVRNRYLGASAKPTYSNTLSDAQARSRSSYNRGATSQYLCGASSFCD